MAGRRGPAPELVEKSVEIVPKVSANGRGDGGAIDVQSVTMLLASMADDILAWNPTNYVERDRQLRAFFPTENTLASAIYSVCAANSALTWELNGPPRTVRAVQEILHGANFGQGWTHFITQVSLDLLTQDNGAFIEIIRMADSATAPVIGINHLDAARCTRTGDPESPVTYWDRDGKPHRMRWYQVIPLAEFPSAVERARGRQYCAVTRALRASQIFRSIKLYQDEKISGRNPKTIHLVGAIDGETITDAIRQAKEHADNQALLRYMDPVIVAGLDPSQTVSVASIELAGLPDHFDMDMWMKWYMTDLALAFGRDYQEFAPLPGGQLGSGAQSRVLAEKSRAKGPGLFMKVIGHALNWHGVVPQNVEFEYTEPDVEREAREEAARKERAERYQIYIETSVLDPPVVLQVLQDEGDIPVEALALQGTIERTPEVTVDDTEDEAETPQQTQVVSARAVDEDPKDRDARLTFAAETNRYQDALVARVRAWTQRTAAAHADVSQFDALRGINDHLTGLRDELVALGAAQLPRSYRLAAPNRQLTAADLLFIDARVAQNTAFIDSSLMPYARSKLVRAINQAEEVRVAAQTQE